MKGTKYVAGNIVSYPNGKLYIAKFANPGYSPILSTYFWAVYTCPSTTTTGTSGVCKYASWIEGGQYTAGNIVQYTDGKLYIANYANPGYNPTISTYYWSVYTHPAWVAGKYYAAGSIVTYKTGKAYIAKYANPGYDPTISTYFWSPYGC